MQVLGTFCEFKYGKSLPNKSRNGGPFPVYGSNGIVGYHDSPLTKGATIIVGRKGSAGALQYSPISCYPIDTTYYIDQSCTDADLRWLFFTLQNLGLERLNKHVAVPGLNRNDAYEKELLVPPLDEQKRIAIVLDGSDALRRQRQESLQYTEKLFQSVFIDMFGDPAMNPKAWPVVPLSELATKFSDGPFGSNLKSSHYTESGVRVLRLQNIGIGALKDVDISFISREHYNSLPRHHCKPGDVIVGTMGEPNLRAAIIPDTLKESLNKADCVQIRPKDEVATAEFLCWLINMPATLAMAHDLVMGETRARVSMGRLKTLKVPKPPFELQQAFGIAVAKIVEMKREQLAQSVGIDSLVSSLKQRAFRGELDLRRVELNDGGASSNLPVTEVRTRDGRTYHRPGSYIAPPEIELEVFALEEKFDQAPAEPRPWSENYFKYRTLSQALLPPFSFAEIWEATVLDMEEASYETVKDKVFEYVAAGTLEQQFDETRKEIVFYPRR